MRRNRENLSKYFLQFFIVFLLAYLLSGSAFGQKISSIRDTTDQNDLIGIAKKVLHIKPGKVKKKKGKTLYLSLLPTTSPMPGGGKVLVTATNAGFYTADRHTTSMSNLTFTPYVSLSGRFGLPLSSNVWLKNNTWNIKGDVRFLYYPQYTWGIGGGQDDDAKILIDNTYIKFYQTALKRIAPHLVAGVGYAMDYFINIKSTADSVTLHNFTDYPYGTKNGSNSFSSGITFTAAYDSRSNSVNPPSGEYVSLVYRMNPKILGSNTNWMSLYLDARKYISFNKGFDKKQQNVLALWTFYWTSLNSDVPYFNLPSIGWDYGGNNSGRGIRQNRYRGTSMLYWEAEWRRDITKNGLLGFVVFANANSVTQQDKFQFRYFNGAVGTGLRVKFNKKSNTNVTLDWGVSKDYMSFDIGLGEVF